MSTSSTSASSFAPLQFTGISQYSSDFQQILSRAVGIAQIPITQLTDEQAQILQQETSLGNLSSAVSSVGSALQTLGNLGAGQALTASSTDDGVVTATATGATSAASYSITNVTSLASPASERSLTSYANGSSTPVSRTGAMQLVYGGTTYNITLGAGQNNPAGLRDAINNLGVGVTASVLTPGNSTYLAVSANTPGATTLKLVDDPTGAATNILTATNQGTNTNFDLNGIAVSTPGTTINNVIPGLTLSFKGTTAASENVTVNLSTDRTQISSALQTLASSYNALQSQLSAQFGTTAGALSGNSILYQIRQAMSSIVQYQGGSSMGNLANLGIEMSNTGQMSFNQSTFDGLSDSQISSASTLLGSSTAGIGGLQNAFNAISEPVIGSVAVQTAQWDQTDTKLTAQIADKTASVERLQQSINQELQAADASIANLTSQQNTLNASITSLSYVSYGYNSSSTNSKSL